MSIALDALPLPDDLVWSDEFDGSLVKQREEVALSGALIIQSGVQLKGRNITLGGAWVTRGVLKQLRVLAEAAPVSMALTLHDGRVFDVLFRRDQDPITSRPVQPFADPDDADQYTLILRFIEV